MHIVMRILAPCLGILAAYYVTMGNMRSGEGHDRAHQSEMSAVEIVKKFEAMAFDDYQPAEAVKLYFSPDIIEHDKRVSGGKNEIIALLENSNWSKSSDKKAQRTINLMLSDDKHVMVFYSLMRSPDAMPISAVDIFRVEKGLIVEHWSVMQPSEGV